MSIDELRDAAAQKTYIELNETFPSSLDEAVERMRDQPAVNFWYNPVRWEADIQEIDSRDLKVTRALGLAGFEFACNSMLYDKVVFLPNDLFGKYSACVIVDLDANALIYSTAGLGEEISHKVVVYGLPVSEGYPAHEKNMVLGFPASRLAGKRTLLSEPGAVRETYLPGPQAVLSPTGQSSPDSYSATPETQVPYAPPAQGNIEDRVVGAVTKAISSAKGAGDVNIGTLEIHITNKELKIDNSVIQRSKIGDTEDK